MSAGLGSFWKLPEEAQFLASPSFRKLLLSLSGGPSPSSAGLSPSCLCCHLSGSDSSASLFHLSRTLEIRLGPQSPMIQASPPIPASLITSVKSHLPCKGLGMWTSLGTVSQSPAAVPPRHVSISGVGESAGISSPSTLLPTPPSPQSRHAAKKGSTQGPSDEGRASTPTDTWAAGLPCHRRASHFLRLSFLPRCARGDPQFCPYI